MTITFLWKFPANVTVKVTSSQVHGGSVSNLGDEVFKKGTQFSPNAERAVIIKRFSPEGVISGFVTVEGDVNGSPITRTGELYSVPPPKAMTYAERIEKGQSFHLSVDAGKDLGSIVGGQTYTLVHTLYNSGWRAAGPHRGSSGIVAWEIDNPNGLYKYPGNLTRRYDASDGEFVFWGVNGSFKADGEVFVGGEGHFGKISFPNP